ncbi:hypothetical protein [Bifidobacterium rousetti]|uniref:hypothetical protein n=1 Tax=Bifidobacterium rousetti TaxID=2045439 RepID=UPI001239876A|nr:hypothetical protein [Bifidobacterium rousetti]
MAALSEELVAYLRSLPAVAAVSRSRIVYADWFREECMRRYQSGEHPVDVFREAGLDPKLIGYKRIERAIARWRTDACVPALPAGRPRKSSPGLSDAERPVASGADAGVGTVPADPRDVLIEQQIHYIHYLEERLRRAESRDR